MIEPSKNSCFSTIHLMIIKELRLERGVHQGMLAQAAGKTPNAWTKIENGQSVLTVDALFGAFTALNITPVNFMSLAENLISEFN
ncbi:helix-turn-helix domain-containing protein, partial [Escherichia coli]